MSGYGYEMGMNNDFPAQKNVPGKGELSPKGDLGKRDDQSFAAGFPRKIKNAGGEDVSSAYLPVRKHQTAIDAQFGPGDKV